MSGHNWKALLAVLLASDAGRWLASGCDKAGDGGRWSRSDDPDPLEAVVMRQTQMIDQLQAEMAEVKARLSRQESSVAFNVRLGSQRSPFTDHDKLLFDVVDLNVGGGYDNVTGLFTAPMGGFYLFSLKITHSPPGSIHAMVVRDGLQIAEVDANGDELDRSSATVAVQLTAGHRLWVEKIDGDSDQVEGIYRSSFTGILIQPDLP